MNWFKFLLLIVFFASCQKGEVMPDIIPYPTQIKMHSGAFKFNETTSIKAYPDTSTFLNEIQLLRDLTGWSLHAANARDTLIAQDQILLIFTEPNNEIQGSYRMEVSRKGIKISASDRSGVFYGVQTLRQIMPAELEGKNIAQSVSLVIPSMYIEDTPAYSWRGLMLDCSRTFLPIDYLKKQIELLSLYKMNMLHLHLTDDQGWRVEIKKYPKLTEMCSEASSYYTNQKGGYYTQDELKELVAYAEDREVTIVPEIEMPGHSSEIFAAYPELSCTGEKQEIFPFFSGPGITQDILCAGKEEVFYFLEDVMDEVLEIFPSKYIHIGGDEAPKLRWKKCADCQRRMKEEGLADEKELQSYFVGRMVEYIASKGRTAIGWDEILEGGLAEGAAVMSWRGTAGGIEAASMGHPVVMSPTSHCYFDYDHRTTSVEEVYSYDPIPAQLPESDSHWILGAQANLWTHIDRSAASMDRQIYPRILALSEVLWTGSGRSGWEQFQSRMKNQFSRLDSLKTKYFDERWVLSQDDSTDPLSNLRPELYRFDFHGFEGADFNYAGMACKIVKPEYPAEGHPWIWRARFWGHEPQLDVSLLERGYYVVYCEVGNLYGNPEAVRRWNTFYKLMRKIGLAQKCALEGMSRGGLIIYNWAAENTEKVACIYADAPVLDGRSWPGGFRAGKGSSADWERFKRAYRIQDDGSESGLWVSPLSKAKQIAESGIPLIHVVGDADEVVPVSENTGPFEKEILKYGGSIEVIHKPGVGHHPHSLADPKRLVDFILRAYHPAVLKKLATDDSGGTS